MIIELKNGSKISSLENNKESKIGAMRGRRLSDKEYNQMIDSDINNSDNRVTELIKELYSN